MADRTSAALFGDIFQYLSEQPPTTERDAFAREMLGRAQHGDYDFSLYQMYADKALEKLGLAKKGRNEDGDETTLYADGNGKFQEE